jgi:hypothetical protein
MAAVYASWAFSASAAAARACSNGRSNSSIRADSFAVAA